MALVFKFFKNLFFPDIYTEYKQRFRDSSLPKELRCCLEFYSCDGKFYRHIVDCDSECMRRKKFLKDLGLND